ncbi:transcription factor Pcc1-domain-containing protein [Phyllosticta citriasiana]|uniref:Transcription factor Pcc1-domain-containing protein n=1 Tax=Phyllosticta citriasiana TaxID=595635 RepID=A0ABR1K925_9PEZI
MTATTPPSDEFPCQLTLNIPLPTPTHARTALRVLAVDAELSPLVQRQLSISAAQTPQNVLRVHYAATTNRMLRVAVNGFFDSLAVVLGIMHECDGDVVMAPGGESVEGAQGVVCVEG